MFQMPLLFIAFNINTIADLLLEFQFLNQDEKLTLLENISSVYIEKSILSFFISNGKYCNVNSIIITKNGDYFRFNRNKLETNFVQIDKFKKKINKK